MPTYTPVRAVIDEAVQSIGPAVIPPPLYDRWLRLSKRNVLNVSNAEAYATFLALTVEIDALNTRLVALVASMTA